MINQVNLPKDKELAKQVLDSHNEIEKQKISQGILGKIWGNSSSIPNNIAALSVIILITVGIIYTCAMMNSKPENIALSIKDFWAIISPLITLSIGFLFGDNKSQSE
jgi:hypothetical protein